MALRLVQVVLPKSREERVRGQLAAIEAVERWTTEVDGERVTLSLLVDAGGSEAVIDRVEQLVDRVPGYRVLLLPVEAALPRPEEPEPAEPKTLKLRLSSRRISRAELLEDLAPGTQVTALYLATVMLSAIVAAVGLLRDNTAVVIGAMVIAPLLTPNMALALATTLGDAVRVRRALKVNVVGLGTALLFAVLVGLIIPIDPTSAEIASRTSVSPSDLLLALAAGMAGALAFTSGVPASLVGVMVAVALLPPLLVAGLLAASGEWRLAGGALLLVGTNLVSVNLAGILTFLGQGLRPRTWWDAEDAKRSTRIALLLWSLLLAALIVLILLSRGG